MKNNLKGYICGIISGVLITGTASGLGIWDKIDVLRNDITVMVNGKTVDADNFLYENTTYLPIRVVGDMLGCSVSYDEKSNIAYIGERGEEPIVKSKYIPTEKVDGFFICLENGIYYILAQYVIDLAKEKGLDVNDDKLVGNKNTTLIIDDNYFQMIFLLNGWRYIPYDTYVDEILPLLN